MEKTVYFRAFEESDADLIYQWMNDDELKSMSMGLNRRMCKDEAVDWVKNRMRHNPYQVFWAICAKDTDNMIGYMSLSEIHYINKSANFSGIVIGDVDYHDGYAWIESYLFLYEYAFERLGLNRVWGEYILDHKLSRLMSQVMFKHEEGILRQAQFKNGKFYDVSIGSVLSSEYFEHKDKGDYNIKNVIKRIISLNKESKKNK